MKENVSGCFFSEHSVYTGVTHEPDLTRKVAWRHRSYNQPFSRYLHRNISGSRPWPFRSRDVIAYVTIWFPRCHFLYRYSIVAESLPPAIFEIMGPKHIGVTTLTFLGHVTSSVTWPIDPPCQFLLVSHWNRTSISSRFRDIWPPNLVRTHRHTP